MGNQWWLVGGRVVNHRRGGSSGERGFIGGGGRKMRKRNIDTASRRDIKYAFLNSRLGAMADVNQTLINSRRAHNPPKGISV